MANSDTPNKAWVIFDDDGKPQFIDADLPEDQFRNWYRNQLKAGWSAWLCEIIKIRS